MTLVDEKEYERYCSCGAYGWDYSDEWRAELRYIWDMSAKEHDKYEVLLYPLPHISRDDDWKRSRKAGNIKIGDGLQDMINRSEQAIAETLAAYARASS